MRIPARNTVRGPALGLVFVLLVVLGWSIWGFLHPPAVLAGAPTPMLWAHRGIRENAAENSVASVSAAVEQGFWGVEVDVYWLPKTGFVVAHDRPDQPRTGSRLLTLDDLLAGVPKAPSYLWLDFKNLGSGNASRAGRALQGLLKKRGMEGRVVVESNRPAALRLLRWAAPDSVPVYLVRLPSSGLRRTVQEAKIALWTGLLRLPAISVRQEKLDDRAAKNFRRLAIFTWTCNTPETVRAAAARGARVILTDLNLSPTFPEMFRPDQAPKGPAPAGPEASPPPRR